MSIWDSLRGHSDQREMFRRTMCRRRLSQAYLFIGPEGIGKHEFAIRLAQALLCQSPGEDPTEPCGECVGCRPFRAGSHPDFLSVRCPTGKRELPISMLIGSEDRRGQEGLCHDLSLAPTPGSRKVAIIDDADTMNEASANSFLKTLEEPPDRAVLLLIASNLDSLLPTIRSRCQLVRFSQLSENDIEALLIEQDIVQSEADAKFAAKLCEGSLETARQLLEPELKSLRTLLFSQLAQCHFSGLDLSKQLADGLAKISGEIPEQRRYCQWLIRFVIEFFRSAVWTVSGQSLDNESTIPEVQSYIKQFQNRSEGLELIGSLIDRSFEASLQLDQNVSVPLTLDSLFDDLSRRQRTLTRS